VSLVFDSRRLVTVQEAAHACSMSRNSFAGLFRNVMGVSFGDFALRHRITAAAEELVRASEPLKAVAANWGFADISHFTRCFVRHYGISPGAYRTRASASAFFPNGNS
jgi:transcriptional regulator GlxA family with amidase domain